MQLDPKCDSFDLELSLRTVLVQLKLINIIYHLPLKQHYSSLQDWFPRKSPSLIWNQNWFVRVVFFSARLIEIFICLWRWKVANHRARNWYVIVKMQIAHGKRNSLTARTNSFTAKANQLRMRYFYSGGRSVLEVLLLFTAGHRYHSPCFPLTLASRVTANIVYF